MATETRAATTAAGLTMETLMALRRPTEVAVSPDGARLAFAVSESFSKPDAGLQSRIWLAERDGEPRQVTRGPGSDTLPRFSPDGRTLVFASDRDHPGRLSLYALGPEPGEARALGAISGSVEDAAWSPDERELLVLAADLGADRAGAQTATRIEERGAAEADPRVTRPHEAWRRLFRVDVETGATREVSPDRVNVWEFAWNGGRHVAAIVSDDPSESAWYAATLALVDVEDRSARPLYEPQWQIQSPALSPDGRSVAFVEGFCSDRGVLAGAPMLLDADGGAPRPLAPELDVSWLAWRDPETLWYAGWRGMGSICGLLGTEGTVRELWAGEATLGSRHLPCVAPSADGGVLAAVKDGMNEPPEVAVLETDAPGRGWQLVSALNGELARLPLPDWRRFEWRAQDGLELEGLLVLPRDREPVGLPLLVLVHGGPTGVWSYQFTNFGMPLLFADAGYAVLMPNPRGSAGRGQDFARANLGDMGGGDLQDILAGVDALVDEGLADTERVGVYGGSYGGFMAAWAITQTDRFAASIPLACVSDWLSFHHTTNIGRFDELFLHADPYEAGGDYFERSPVVHARRVRTPTLVVHGALDLCTPLGQGQELYQALAEAGVETELVVYPREGHGFLEWDHQVDLWNRMRHWFDRHLGVVR